MVNCSGDARPQLSQTQNVSVCERAGKAPLLIILLYRSRTGASHCAANPHPANRSLKGSVSNVATRMGSAKKILLNLGVRVGDTLVEYRTEKSESFFCIEIMGLFATLTCLFFTTR